MLLLYNFLLYIGFLALLPRIILQKEYRDTLRERLGHIPTPKPSNKKTVWLHCVSVGETQAARPLVNQLIKELPNHRLVISTTTVTGQKLARELFENQADMFFYFPLDFPFSVRRTLQRIKPEVILLMETELWFNLINEASKNGVKIFVVNARLSEKSVRWYRLIKRTIKKILRKIDLVMAQSETDAKRFRLLGVKEQNLITTGNLKFDQSLNETEHNLSRYFADRFGIDEQNNLILAASTHDPEESWLIEAIKLLQNSSLSKSPRLMIAPRHPERFNSVAEQMKLSGFRFVRRSGLESPADRNSTLILLDSIGELRSVMPLAKIVFVGGSLIPHGGQNILEAAIAKKPIVTGFYTMNFQEIVNEFLKNNALIQLPKLEKNTIPAALAEVFAKLLNDQLMRDKIAENAFKLMARSRGASIRSVEALKSRVVE